MCGLELKPNRWILRCVQTTLTIEVYGVSGGTGAKCAGGIDKEHLRGYDVVEGRSLVKENSLGG